MVPQLFSYSQVYKHVSTSKGLTLVLDSTDFSYIVFPAELVLGSSFPFLIKCQQSYYLICKSYYDNLVRRHLQSGLLKASCFKIIAECMGKCKEPQKEVLCPSLPLFCSSRSNSQSHLLCYGTSGVTSLHCLPNSKEMQ